MTNKEHLHDRHKIYASQNVENLRAWGREVGSAVDTLFASILENKRIAPISAIRQMAKAQKLALHYGRDRLAAACGIANTVGVQTVESVENILKNEIDLRRADKIEDIATRQVAHDNVRGADSYSGE